ncbi:MAG: hypothetical protein C4536_04540 [Actinobacteria bacterium]|jgi:hypothetical protein|nr:MAG: hypothetical protein C4536_04540 [Actinomycetota bacterium]
MRDTISRLVEGLNASDPGELAGELFREDGEFSRALIAAVPRLVSAAAEAVKLFVESMEGLPADKGAELVAGAYAQLEGGEIAEAVNAFSRLVIRLHEENPELFPVNRVGIVSDFMEATDFGKLRVAATYHFGDRLDLARREVELLGENPMALINIFSLVAPLVNDALQVLKALFAILALPAEAVTYALFKIMEDLDWQDVAAVINGLAAFVVNVHRGSMILGDGSLYTRGPLTRISSELVSTLDGQVLAEAIVAIGEEGEMLSTALAGQVLANEDLVLPLTEAAVFVANSSFRAAADILEKANAMPQEMVNKMVAAVAEDLEVKELGRALVSLAAFNRRVIAENPELIAAMSREALSALELEVSPETLAARTNRGLHLYNEWVRDNPGIVAGALDGFLAGVDAQQLGQAAQSSAAQVADALSRNPAVMKPLLKAAMSILYGSVKGYVKGLAARRKAKGV